MPECIVCKGYYSPDTMVCRRCSSDNTDWERWLKDEPVEQEGMGGLLHFTKPHCYLPFFIIFVALALGLTGVGIEKLWKEVTLFTCLLAIAASVVVSLFVLLGVYRHRHKLREDHLLERVRIAAAKKKPKKVPEVHVKVGSRTVFVLAMIAMLVLLIACVLVQSETAWKLSEMVFIVEKTSTPTPTPTPGSTPISTPTLEPTPTPTPPLSLRVRVRRAVPLIFLGGYVSLSPALVYLSSMLLAQGYIRRMNQELPQPIFLQDENLARIVRREAEVELGRLAPESANVSRTSYVRVEGQIAPHQLRIPPSVDIPVAEDIPLPPQVDLRIQAATWVWDELERTDDGGIEMKVARQEIYQLSKPTKDSGHNPSPRVSYLVRADPWGHITEIRRSTNG